MKQDRLYDMNNGKTKVRLAIQWIYSLVKLLEDILNLLRTQKSSDQQDLTELRSNLEHMQSPFSTAFMKVASDDLEKSQKYSSSFSKPLTG